MKKKIFFRYFDPITCNALPAVLLLLVVAFKRSIDRLPVFLIVHTFILSDF